jgi:hypothetical protein
MRKGMLIILNQSTPKSAIITFGFNIPVFKKKESKNSKFNLKIYKI